MARAGGAASRCRAGDALAGDRRRARERRCRTLGSRARVHVGERRWPARRVGARAARPRAGAAPAAAALAEPAGRPPFGPGGSLDRDRGDGGRRSARAGARGGARRQSGRDRRRGRASLRGMSALIVVPVFNEAETVGSVVAAARAYAPVLVVDDGSRDESAEIARRAGAEVICHPRRRGKGAAIRTGITAARERGASAVVTLDGDGQHSPSDLGLLLDAARARRRTIVVGGRLDEAAALPPDRLNAIRVAGFFVNWACGLKLHDTQSGFRVYPIELFDDIRLRRGGFVLETEVLMASVARGWRVHEVPVAALGRA